MLNRRHILKLSLLATAYPLQSLYSRAANWQQIEAEAKGQTLFFNAWAGSDTINAYIAWAGEQIKSSYGITLEHVKITDTAEVVRRVRDEVAAGKQDGSVDLVWINGENFRAMKQEKLLFGPWSESLPNFAFVDVENKPTTRMDFSEAVNGMEAPWGMAQLTFFADGQKLPSPPMRLTELLALAKSQPGRITYPAPPDFHGTTFVKQVLLETAADPSVLAAPASADIFSTIEGPLFAALDDLHRFSWREGKQFPKAQADVTNMVADGELLMGITFNPNEAANLVASGRLPTSTIAWQHSTGTVGNTHFLAIPVNARSKAAAQIFANFLLSPLAQARKNDLKIWGDPTVLNVQKLSAEEQKLFSATAAPGSVTKPGPTLLEPHATWVPLLEAAWLNRYGKG